MGITRVAGSLTDHYDPRDNRLHLSDDNYRGASVASVAVACHEAGHAIQAARGFSMYRLRTALVPAVNFAQQGWALVLLRASSSTLRASCSWPSPSLPSRWCSSW